MESLRPEELHSAEQLKSFLEPQGYQVSYKPGANPPDIVMQVGRDIWAVEHTSLHEYVEAGGGEFPRVGWDEMVRELGQRLLKATEGKRKASWSLIVLGPFSKDVLKEIEESVTEAIIRDDPAYFRQREYPNAEDTIAANEDITLIRHEDGTRGIAVASGLRVFSQLPGSGKQVALVQARTEYAIERILNDKKIKLCNITDYDKLVLLIENRDVGIDSDIVADCLRNTGDLSSFLNLIFFADADKITIVSGVLK